MLYTSGTTGRPKGAVRPAPDPAVILPLLTHIGFVEDDVYGTTGPLLKRALREPFWRGRTTRV